MNLTRLLKTSSFRLTLGYASLFGASVLVLAVVIYFAATNFIAVSLDAEVAAEIDEILSARGKEGLAGLTGEVQLLTLHPEAGMSYLLQDAQGNILSGTLGPMAPIEGVRVWDETTPQHPANAPPQLRGRGLHVADGAYLFVGIDSSEIAQLGAFVAKVFLWACAVIVAIGLAGGGLMSLGVLRRIEAIMRASNQIVDQDWSRRVPLRGSGDEFDQLADNLNSLFDRIQALMGGLRQVSNDIAHDLRTPLTRLRQRLELAQTRATCVAQFQDVISSSIRDVDTILDTFGALLRVAEIESGARKSGFAQFDFAAVLRDIAEDYQPVVEEAGDRMVTEIAGNLSVRGDRQLLVQMVANLIENAIRHCQPPAIITLAARRADGAVVVEVRDNGPGIPQAQHAKVFQRLYRLDASRTTSGTGMGLAIVAAIAALHGIEITLTDNHPGLVVRLRFPTD